ncbi:unnamed protein product [Thlaspi arvense]|uniref:Pentatricopeptide repeat-containing protein n=1 Tax=Thlaspi arvense TaxID=13288 RepID=A0AAU9RS29_THLAR|nr:unnamed protein product [Thlaspi arvense]
MWRAMSTSCLISRNLTWEKTIVHPNHSERTFTEKLLALLKLCVSTKMLQQIHTQMLINTIHKPNFLLSKLIDLKDFNYSFLFFSRILEPNDYAFNIMVRGLTTTWKKFDLALKLYYQMKFSGLKPNNFTYPFLFIACANLLASEHGRMGHAMIFKDGLNVILMLIFIDHHVFKMWRMVCARKVFDEIPKRDLVSWNSMISGYFKMGFAGEAVAMFEKMRDEGFEPDDMTVASVLGACGDLGDLNLGRWLEGFVLNGQVEVNSYVVSPLIDMYAKCGELMSARRVFDTMKGKNVVIWNAMITG